MENNINTMKCDYYEISLDLASKIEYVEIIIIIYNLKYSIF